MQRTLQQTVRQCIAGPSTPASFCRACTPNALRSIIPTKQRLVHTSTPRKVNTVNAEEINHFSSLAAHWWNESGSFGVLQRMNRVRVEFLRERLLEAALYESRDPEADRQKINGPRMLEGLRVLDVGCGGGLFSERLSRLGARTLAVDASNENVQTAILHASQDPQQAALMANGNLEYRNCAAEDLLPGPDKSTEQFDIVFAMEILEHVDDPQNFLRCIADLTKPGGHIILSTISRTPLAKFLTINFAESPLVGFAPAGSHTYEKFIKSSELVNFFRSELGWGASRPVSPASESATSYANDLNSRHRSLRYDMEVRGTTYLPWKGEWTLFPKDQPQSLRAELTKSCNYFFGARKPLSA